VTVRATEVDVARLRAWLSTAVPACGVTAQTSIVVTKLGGGYSNLTFDVAFSDGANQEHLILRRPPVGVRADRGAHDMRREFRVLSAVYGSAVPVPKPIALCDDESVLGGMFFLMSRIDGTVVRTLSDAPALRDPAVMRCMSESCIDGLAALHRVPVLQTALYDPAKVAGYGERQVAGWTARWAAARPPDVPDADAAAVFQWLAEQLPPPIDAALLHNDWKFDNLVVDPADPSRICGVLDWEMAAVGDPRFDLATSLGYWVQANDPPMLQALALGVTAASGCLTREEVVTRYAQQSGIAIDAPVYWWVFGLAKLAVIVVQLYARYVAGGTTDARFAPLGGMAALLMRTARNASAHNSLQARSA
jgi:aminoglycoside phosphotransferase (APT) family kinase protein